MLAGLVALPATSCATVSAPAPTLTVATYNIYHDRGDWPARMPLVIEALRSSNADVIGLQEVLEDAASSLPNQARTLASALGSRMVFSSTDAEGAPRRYGNAVLTKLPILEQDWTRLEPREDYRTALRVRVSAPGGPVDVINTHLHHTPEGAAIRAQQTAHLLRWIGARPAPLIVMGDFNAVLDDPGLSGFSGPRFVSALAPGAAPTTLNTTFGHTPRVIDHIFAEATAFEPVSSAIIGDTAVGAIWPSDHFGVAATLRRRSPV